jgi:hypothetical protein
MDPVDALFEMFEVTVTAPAVEPPAPVPAGGTVTTVLTAERVSVTVTVETDSLAEAAILGAIAAGPLGRMRGAEMTVRPVPA